MTDTFEQPFGPLIDTTLRVMSWNLWWRFGPWQERQAAIIETLRRVDADVIALQEVWDDGRTGQADLLADALGFHAAFDARMSFGDVRMGNAVLCRWPITGTTSRAYSTEGDTQEDRLVLRADIDGPRGPLQVFSTHLNWRLDHSRPRQAQVRQLCEFVADSRPRSFPAIVCGDFNADPLSDEIEMMTGRAAVPVDRLVFLDSWETGGDGTTGATWSKANPYAEQLLEPDRRIDYVFTGWPRAGGAGSAVRCRVAADEPIDGVWPSDHFAVTADLRY
ncbi:MAG: endonuclease/exonuclease/phosphatase family protein [Acidimicrobiales bacterium]